jgi:arylsulfatase A-like enzyme
MKGPEIKPSASIDQPQIIDIAPTVLYLLNQPVPKDMDGRVLEEAFHLGVFNIRPVTYVDADGEEEKKPEDSLATGDEEQVYKHLKDLGYL